MKRFVWIAAGSVVLGCAFGGSLEACGGGDDSVAAGTDSGVGGDGTIGTGDDSGSGVTDSGTVTDGGGGSDGGGGPVSNPGKATCGPTISCDLDAGGGGSPFCCERSDGGDSCETSGGACGGVTFQLACDEPADCPNNKPACCMNTSSIGLSPDASVSSGQAQCSSHCGGGDLILCKTSAQCGDGGTCAKVTCHGGDTFFACNTNADCK